MGKVSVSMSMSVSVKSKREAFREEATIGQRPTEPKSIHDSIKPSLIQGHHFKDGDSPLKDTLNY